MKYKIILFIILSTVLFAQPSKKQIMDAMRDEASRNLKELKLDNLERPYFIEYQVAFVENNEVSGSLGTIIESTNDRFAYLTTNIRVGNYKFDNSNFFDFGFNFFGSADDEERFKKRLIPFSIDYQGLRRELWLATDAAYKQASEVFSKKIATKKNRLINDTTHDFIPALPVKYEDKDIVNSFDKVYFEKLVREVSAVFKNYPEIQSSKVNLENLPKTIFTLNTEGTELIRKENYYGIEIVAFAQCEDGEPLSNFISYYSESSKDLPNIDSLKKATKQLCEVLKARISANKLNESYSGPVLFEGQAATELIAQFFAPNLVTQRPLLTENGIQENDRNSAFQNKIGSRVLPEFLSMEDKPEALQFKKIPLMGSYKVDDEGITADNLVMVKEGYLKTLLATRIPNKKIQKSNGRNRRGGALYSNLFISSKEEKELTHPELKQKLIELIKNRDLPFGIIIKKIHNTNIFATAILSLAMGSYNYPKQNMYIPLEIYKVYPDGKEEIIRGCNGIGMNTLLFKDIIAVSKEQYLMNFLAPAATGNFFSGGDSYIPASIISPSLLFEDSELKTIDSDFKKPPIIASPLK